MKSDPFSGPPPDDTGSDTLDRYKYQLHTIAHYCIVCATQSSVKKIYVEYYEDFVVERGKKWEFIQVKSKSSPNNWTLNRAAGGLASLYRAFENTESENCSYVLMIEGKISPHDDVLKKLKPSSNNEIEEGDIGEVSSVLEKEIGKEVKHCREWLEKVTIRQNMPVRRYIDDFVKKRLAENTKGVPYQEVDSAYEDLVDMIISKMSNVDSDRVPFSGENGEKVWKKDERKITESGIRRRIGGVLDGPYPLLARELDTKKGKPTDLERKLLAAGASDNMVRTAKQRRAAAVHRKEEASNIFSEDEVADVEERVQGRAVGEVAKHLQLEKPATGSFAGIQNVVSNHSDDIDSRGIFRRDPELLFGLACELSDRCKINWGESIEHE